MSIDSKIEGYQSIKKCSQFLFWYFVRNCFCRTPDTDFVYFFADGSQEGLLTPPKPFPVIKPHCMNHVIERHFGVQTSTSCFKNISPVKLWELGKEVVENPNFVTVNNSRFIYTGVSSQAFGLGISGCEAHVLKIVSSSKQVVTMYPDYSIF